MFWKGSNSIDSITCQHLACNAAPASSSVEAGADGVAIFVAGISGNLSIFVNGALNDRCGQFCHKF